MLLVTPTFMVKMNDVCHRQQLLALDTVQELVQAMVMCTDPETLLCKPVLEVLRLTSSFAFQMSSALLLVYTLCRCNLRMELQLEWLWYCPPVCLAMFAVTYD